jgi:hypothetical protein
VGAPRPRPQVYNASVYEIFGGLKKKWPALTTMAVLDWETFPSDLPLDIWVDVPASRFGTVLGAQEISTIANPCRKYFLEKILGSSPRSPRILPRVEPR